MSLPETRQLLEQAQSGLMEAKRLLDADPTNEWAKMAVELLRDEVELFRQLLNGYEERQRGLGRAPRAHAPTR